MTTKDELADLFYVQIELLCHEHNVSEADHRAASRDLADQAVGPLYKQYLVVMKKGEDGEPEVTHFDLWVAIGLLVALIGALAGASLPLAIALAVIGCVIGFKGLPTEASLAEGLLFKAIYDRRTEYVSRDQAEMDFADLCEVHEGARPEDFSPALQGLLHLGILGQSAADLRIKHKVLPF